MASAIQILALRKSKVQNGCYIITEWSLLDFQAGLACYLILKWYPDSTISRCAPQAVKYVRSHWKSVTFNAFRDKFMSSLLQINLPLKCKALSQTDRKKKPA